MHSRACGREFKVVGADWKYAIVTETQDAYLN